MIRIRVTIYVPIPEPKSKEKQNNYMGRCMEFMKDEKYPQKQKVAICLNTFSGPQKKAKANDRDGIEIDFSDKIKEMKEKKLKDEADKQIIEEKIETPIVPENVLETPVETPAEIVPVIEPAHTAVTAPAEVVNEVKLEEKHLS